MLKKTVKNYQGPVVLRNLSMWFFGAVLEYCGKRNSNIGKKRSTKFSTRAGLSPDRGRCDGFSFAESSKIKNWTSSRKKAHTSEVLFFQVHSTRGCTRAWPWACSAQLASNVTILNLVCIVRCHYNTSETPSLGFLHLSVIVKTQWGGFEIIPTGSWHWNVPKTRWSDTWCCM